MIMSCGLRKNNMLNLNAQTLDIKIRVKITYENGRVVWYRKVSKRRFCHFCSLKTWKLLYLWVGYEKSRDIHGKLVKFYNDGIYDNGKEALQAGLAFLE